MAQRAATVADVRAQAPGLALATDEQILTALEVTAPLVYVARHRHLASLAHAQLAAHWLATTPGLGLDGDGFDTPEYAGPVTAEADGPTSRSHGAVASSEALAAEDALLATTPYGRKFLAYRAAVRGWGQFLAGSGSFPA